MHIDLTPNQADLLKTIIESAVETVTHEKPAPNAHFFVEMSLNLVEQVELVAIGIKLRKISHAQ